MTERLTTSIVLYGAINSTDARKWHDWFEFSTELTVELGHIANYIGVNGTSFKSGKIWTLNRTEKKLKQAFEAGEEFNSISIYSLQEDFKQAAFDYDIYLSRTKQSNHPHIIVTMSSAIFTKVESDALILRLKKHIEFTSGQIFQMSNYESPQIYAIKANSLSVYKTLKILENIG